jgi:hypothetical protein
MPSADVLIAVEGHRLLLTAVSKILPAEADLAVVCGYEAVVGDDDAMGVPPDVVAFALINPNDTPVTDCTQERRLSRQSAKPRRIVASVQHRK